MTAYTTIITIFIIIYLAESVYEVRLYTFLNALNQSPSVANSNPRLGQVIKLERWWNWISWLFIIVIIFTSDLISFVLIDLLVLIETIVLILMNQIRHQYN